LFFCLGMNEYEGVKKNYTKVLDAYGCLGIMRINAGENNSFFSRPNLVNVIGAYLGV